MHGFGLYTGIRSTVKWPANRYSVMYNHTSRLCSPEVQNISCVIGVTHTSLHWPSPHSRHSSMRSHWTPRAPHPIVSCLLQRLAHIYSLWQLLPQDFDRANWFLVPHFSIAFDNKHWALNSHVRSTRVTVSQEHVFQLIQSQNVLSHSESSSALQFFLPVSWNNNYATTLLSSDISTVQPIWLIQSTVIWLYVTWCGLVGLVEYRS